MLSELILRKKKKKKEEKNKRTRTLLNVQAMNTSCASKDDQVLWRMIAEQVAETQWTVTVSLSGSLC